MVAADGFGAVLRCPLRPVPDLTLRVFFCCCCFLLALGLPARCLPALAVLREAVFFPLRFVRTSPEIARVTPCRNPVINAFIDRKSTRLNSSHRCISYAVFCLKKKKKKQKKRNRKYT